MTREDRQRRWLRRAEKGLFAAAFLLLGAGALGAVGGRVYQAYAMRTLEQRAQAAEEGRGDAPSVAGPGDLLGRIEIPRIGLTSLVLEGTDHRSLLLGVGHLRGTVLPGEKGQAVLAGHRDTFFRALEGVTVGDTVRVDTGRGGFEYRVVSTEVLEPEEIRIQDDAETSTLLLVTCYPFRYVGPAPKRFVVQGAAVPAVDQGGGFSRQQEGDGP